MEHFLLKCDRCKWHTEIDQACIANPCPNCNGYNYPNLITGTKQELEKYLGNFHEN